MIYVIVISEISFDYMENRQPESTNVIKGFCGYDKQKIIDKAEDFINTRKQTPHHLPREEYNREIYPKYITQIFEMEDII